MIFLYKVFIYGALVCYMVLTVTTNLDQDFEDYYEDYDDFSELNFTANGTLQFLKELSNITRRSGKTVKLLCEVKNTDTNGTSTKVRFTWRQNYAVIDQNDRITIKNIEKPEVQVYASRLRIANVNLFDRGFYDCTASNGIDKIQSQGVLEIINEKWGNSPSDIPTFKPVFEGTQTHKADGDITTFFPNIERKARDEVVSTITNPILPTLSEQTIKNPLMFEKSVEELPQVNDISTYNVSQPFCQLYKGSTCKHYLDNKYVFVQPPYTQQNIETKLENAVLVVSQSNRHKKKRTADFIDNVSVAFLNQGEAEEEVAIRVYTDRRLIIIDFNDPEKDECKAYFFNKIMVTLQPTADTVLLRMRTQIIRFRFPSENAKDLFVSAITLPSEISSSCSKFAVPSLCFSAFPICVDSNQINTYQKDFINKFKIEQDPKIFKNIRNKLSMSLQRICKEDCELLEKELCRREYAIAKRHPVISQPLELDECEFLPDETDKNSLYCLSLGVQQTQNVNQDDDCFWDYGDLYRGIQDISLSGKKCIRWSHQFKIALSEYPELSGHSYCRNPGRVEEEPFCYIEQNKREVCGLHKCANIIWLYLSTGIAITFLIVTIGAMSVYCYRKRKNQKSRLQSMNVPTADKNIYGNTGPNSPMELNTLLPTRINNMPPRSHSSHRNGFQSVPQYTYKEVSFVEELGEGAFGKVYKGDLKTKSGKIIVAVKSLKENASAKTQADFQREIELISELKHPNIICLLGVVVKQEPMCMLFEYMSEGDLHEFLITNSPDEGKCLSQQQFLHIAAQIAQGMDYLSENHYVHRDLAARNCLVSKDLVVKISDFGLSRDMYSCDYYRVQSKSLLPVRWMPPESILYGKFTTESDVWSYGVVLWEIYSYGLQPYYGYNNQEVISMIRSRKLLPCPDSCPSYCYVLMVECWAELAIRRPNFSEIVHRLKMWKQNGSASGAYFKNPEVHMNQQKHSSKSSHTSDSPTVCPSFDNQSDPPNVWEKNLRKTSANKLNESQSSLTSHSSSLGNRTQSTSLSNDHNIRNSRKSVDRKNHKSSRNDNTSDGLNPKNIVVSSNGDSFETKLSF